MRSHKTNTIALYFVIAAALAYCTWLGWHWLPLDYSDKEFGGFVSRLWDVRRELTEQHSLPWWTQYYMSGSSYGLHHSQALYLIPSLAFSAFFDLLTSVKLTALLAIFASAVAMYFCARQFVRNEWAAALAAIVFLLHPEQVIRAAGTEHLGISVFLPFVPLTWLFFARALESGKVADLFWCALAVTGSIWAHNKMALVNLLFLAGYFGYWVFYGASAVPNAPGRQQRARNGLRTCALVGILSLSLGAFFIVPALTETKHVKLFEGEPIGEWQSTYAFKSLFALMDRDGVVTREAIDRVVEGVNARGGARSQLEYDQARRIVLMQTDSPEKYAGLVLLALLAATALANYRRENRPLFWFVTAAFLASVMFAYGRSSVWSANATSWSAVMNLRDVPPSAKLAILFAALTVAAMLVLFYYRKLDTRRKRFIAGAALGVFLFLPAFTLIASAPLFEEIRSPYVFYDASGALLGALLSGFFVTDVLKSRVPQVVALLTVLLLIDYWPYQQPTRETGVPARTLENLRAALGSLRRDDDTVKVYMFSGRYFRLLGPMLSGKPLAYEDFYNWMAPKGIGYLNAQASGQPALFNLLGARYIVFDKSDPRMAGTEQALQAFRERYPIVREDEDFVVFRNAAARPYLSAFAQASRFEGDARHSVPLALALSEKNWPLIHADAATGGSFAYVYRAGESAALPERDGQTIGLRIESLMRERAGVIRAVVTSPEPSWLVINESYYPYWRAALGGSNIPLYRASAGLMAVQLPAGKADLTLQFSPPLSYRLAQMLSILAFVFALTAWWRERRHEAR